MPRRYYFCGAADERQDLLVAVLEAGDRGGVVKAAFGQQALRADLPAGRQRRRATALRQAGLHVLGRGDGGGRQAGMAPRIVHKLPAEGGQARDVGLVAGAGGQQLFVGEEQVDELAVGHFQPQRRARERVEKGALPPSGRATGRDTKRPPRSSPPPAAAKIGGRAAGCVGSNTLASAPAGT